MAISTNPHNRWTKVGTFLKRARAVLSRGYHNLSDPKLGTEVHIWTGSFPSAKNQVEVVQGGDDRHDDRRDRAGGHVPERQI